MTIPASTADVEARFRELTEAEASLTSVLLDDAWSLLTARRPTLEADLTAGTVSTGNAVRVVCAMVIRVLRNPGGYTYQTTGPFAVSRSGANASGMLTVTDEELAVLAPARGVRSVRLVAPGSEWP